MNIGDKLICDNNKTYTIGKCNDLLYDFSLIDDNNEEVNLYEKYALEDCLPYNGSVKHSLCVGSGEYTYIISIVK